ncbi:MAG: DUF1015 domain-containing protein [Solirubrobacteraceae bacterium]
MAEILPLRALRYDPDRTGGLQSVVAPPYDVIDDAQLAALLQRSPYNVVAVDLPRGDEDRYERAAQLLSKWRVEGAIVLDESPALWAIQQDYTGPDARTRTRRGFFARVRVEEYGAGRIRPHERTHPGPREDRLRLTRATRANLSPIFSLYADPTGAARAALARATGTAPWAQTTDDDGTVNRLWRIDEPDTIASLQRTLRDAELLIADGHHRYETARVYADEVGGEGPHRFTLMCLVALEDPGLTVFPTHRLVRDLSDDRRRALADELHRDFDAAAADAADAGGDEGDGDSPMRIGYLSAQSTQASLLTLKDQSIADAALADHAEPYRRLDTAVLEALVLKGALELTDDDIDHMRGLGYARDLDQARRLVADGDFDAAFLMAPTPVAQVQAVAAAGESMPPKSTYFFPKVPTGLLFNPLA